MDLAAKFSAMMVTERSGGVPAVITEDDSLNHSSFEVVARIKELAADCDLVVIEDVPYGISSQAQVKPVLRLQGMVIGALADKLTQVVFVNPSTWQKHYPGVSRGPSGDRVEAARQHAAHLNYSPPDLVQRYVDSLPEGTKVLKKHTNPLAKVMTDYIDAYLMADWAHQYEDINALLEESGVQPAFI